MSEIDNINSPSNSEDLNNVDVFYGGPVPYSAKQGLNDMFEGSKLTFNDDSLDIVKQMLKEKENINTGKTKNTSKHENQDENLKVSQEVSNQPVSTDNTVSKPEKKGIRETFFNQNKGIRVHMFDTKNHKIGLDVSLFSGGQLFIVKFSAISKQHSVSQGKQNIMDKAAKYDVETEKVNVDNLIKATDKLLKSVSPKNDKVIDTFIAPLKTKDLNKQVMNEKGEMTQPLLQTALENGHLNIAKKLIESGADVNKMDKSVSEILTDLKNQGKINETSVTKMQELAIKAMSGKITPESGVYSKANATMEQNKQRSQSNNPIETPNGKSLSGMNSTKNQSTIKNSISLGNSSSD